MRFDDLSERIERATPPAMGVPCHETDAVGPFWVFAFGDGGDDVRARGLVARELDDRYDGFRTYDPALVGEMSSRLASVEG